MQRSPLSAKTRFEVFKRDRFICMYCGAHPPSVILHVDHIVPVAKGGKNFMENLVTSCERCNLGKGAVSLSTVPQSLADKAAEIKEREAQLKGFSEVMNSWRERRNDEAWMVVHAFEPGAREYSRARLQSIKNFVDRLGVSEVLEAAEIAMARVISYNKSASEHQFRYFCGICWKKIKAEDAANG